MGLGLSDVGASRRFRRLDGRQHSPVELAEQAPELVHEALDSVAAQGQLQLHFASIAAHALQESPLRQLVDDAGRRAAVVTIFSGPAPVHRPSHPAWDSVASSAPP